MDDFRKEQKRLCADGGRSKSTYGCPCCRLLSNLNHFKKLSRRMAKAKLRAQTKARIEEDKLEDGR